MTPPLHLAGGLANYPELAKEIGFLIADYAALEGLLCELYLLVTDGTVAADDGFSTFFGMRSINNKTKLITDAAQHLPARHQTAIKRVVRRMKGAAARRTEIAHVHIHDDGKGPMRVHLIGGAAKVTPLTDEFVARTADQFRTLGIDVIVLVSILAEDRADQMIERSQAASARIDKQLRRPPPPQEFQSPLSADEQNSSEVRLGLKDPSRVQTVLRANPSYQLSGVILDQ